MRVDAGGCGVVDAGGCGVVGVTDHGGVDWALACFFKRCWRIVGAGKILKPLCTRKMARSVRAEARLVNEDNG